jgi:hypothetical protein
MKEAEEVDVKDVMLKEGHSLQQCGLNSLVVEQVLRELAYFLFAQGVFVGRACPSPTTRSSDRVQQQPQAGLELRVNAPVEVEGDVVEKWWSARLPE